MVEINRAAAICVRSSQNLLGAQKLYKNLIIFGKNAFVKWFMKTIC